ncbi:MAG: bifunctional phosphopantothenoylcysteine decarboxylase/phosphopantothenate--cysteine ligase CoaBC [Heliobacteriaceae bacterium]|jgi:phosphopantothenoylcysteine decarboxylase/phosphopantothenate--cysteine ligase|nr:bifunctional phosphopantothenoylcysteine decarboxylase/phosphopantothenate--cysteine ligase CoaBC [Heliobacteriaceae bacterium]
MNNKLSTINPQPSTVLIGITGGIAAYKICELIRMFKRHGANVYVVCTPNALNFVTCLTLRSLSGNEVAVEQFEIEEFKPEHISCAERADVMVIAPCSANTLSKLAQGICDNLLTSVACAFSKPVIIAPAMNCNMWENKIIQENAARLERAGYEILPPDEGFLACGYSGKGRLCKLEKIFDRVQSTLSLRERAGVRGLLKIVITAGGTVENIDPVRYISNHSSGKMGAALAKAARRMGAQVVLIDAAEHSALELQKAVKAEAADADCIIMAAAVADYRPKEAAAQKIKKDLSPRPLWEREETLSEPNGELSVSGEGSLTLELIPNPDILQELCKNKREGQIIVGFCAESENLLENAKEKIKRKGCDFLVANDISRKDIGFGADENEVYILDKNLNAAKLDKAPKAVIAAKILEAIYGG